MPWEVILGAVGGSSFAVIVSVVLGLFFAQRVVEKVVDSGARRFESTMIRAEEAYKSALEMGARSTSICASVGLVSTRNSGERRNCFPSGPGQRTSPTIS